MKGLASPQEADTGAAGKSEGEAHPLRNGGRRAVAGQLGEEAYRHIRDMIMSGAFPPSMPLREVDLVRAMEVSRTPIREALQRLQAEGLIVPLAAGGYTAIELGRKEMADIYQVREVLTGLAARLAAQNRSRVDLARLEEIIDVMEAAAAAEDRASLDSSIRDFFRYLSKAGKNGYLHALNGKVVDFFRYHALAVTHPDWVERARRDIRLIVDAIAAGDADTAERLARAHIAKAMARRMADIEEKRQLISGGTGNGP